MFFLLYQLCIVFLSLIFLPKLLWQRWVHGKYKQSWKEKFWAHVPCGTPGKIHIWIHAVSLGETKAAVALYEKIRKEYPEAEVFISNTTETGYAEAKKSMSSADGFFFLPIDFLWNAKRVIQSLQPDLIVFVESDFWYNFLHTAKKKGCSICFANGKISERSCKRLSKAPFFARRLFSLIDCLCVQNESYAKRFQYLGADPSHIHVTGNTKLDIPFEAMPTLEKKEWQAKLGTLHPVITIGSTHGSEEELLLTQLLPLWRIYPNFKILLVPRHPERFTEVAELLKNMNLSFIRYSQIEEKTGKEQVVLIDAMGILMSCYEIADLAIVAGSFRQGIGGHNIFEPILAGTPVLFGPYMEMQTDLVELVLKAEAGYQVDVKSLCSSVQMVLENQVQRGKLKTHGKQLVSQLSSSTQKTWEEIRPYLLKKALLKA